MRLTVRVYPGSRTTRVGGRYGTDDPPVLKVRVTAPAVDGKANQAAIHAVAAAFDIPASAVHLAAGRTRRTKILDLVSADPRQLANLLDRMES